MIVPKYHNRKNKKKENNQLLFRIAHTRK